MASYAKFDVWQNTAGITRQSVIQAVQMTTTNRVSTTSTTFADATGYSATITPNFSTSKILVLATLYHGCPVNYAIWFKLLRDSTPIAEAVGYHGAGSNSVYTTLCSPINYLDSPNTTNPVNYKIQFRSDGSGNTVVLGGANNNAYTAGTSLNNNTIVLLEIAS